jgi:hypothetical protein
MLDAFLLLPYPPEPAPAPVSVRCAMPVAAARLVDGALPPGLRLSPRGTLEGLPTVPGDFSFVVELSDGCSRRLEVRQLRVLPAPVLVAEAEQTDFHCLQNAPDFPAGLVRVSGSAPGRPYSVEVLYADPRHAGWLTAAPRSGALPPDGSALEADRVALSLRPAKLPAGAYAARLRFHTWQGVNAPEIEIRLRVDTPHSVLTPLTTLAPTSLAPLPTTEAPPLLPAPAVPRQLAPVFPKYRPPVKPKVQESTPVHRHSPARSRVLPIPKLKLDDPPPARTKPDIAAPPPKPAAKPSAMPPPAKSAAH